MAIEDIINGEIDLISFNPRRLVSYDEIRDEVESHHWDSDRI
jgi:hypothetical protein